MACTAGMIKVCARADDLPADWLDGLLSPDYGRMLYASQFLTEVQGGSDVGANAVVARPADGELGGQGWWSLTGEKWFCSVIDANLFLVTARPEGAKAGTSGLRAFVVPRALPGQDPRDPRSEPNRYAVRRLKWKLGTRSMASAEVDFEGAYGWPVADFVRTVDVVLNTSRLYNAVCAAAILQRSWREADGWARTRLAFGQPVLAFPAVARTVAKLRVEAHAARSLTFHLAALADQLAVGAPDPALSAAWRMLVNLNKIWTALTCPAGVRDAIEVLGGNGAIEEFSILPRLLRDSIVLEAWEGGHGVLCSQLLKDSRRGLHRPMFAHLREVAGEADVPTIDALAARWDTTLSRADADVVWRDLVEASRTAVQAMLLRAQGVDPAVVEHLVCLNARGYDPLDDPGLAARLQAVIA